MCFTNFPKYKYVQLKIIAKHVKSILPIQNILSPNFLHFVYLLFIKFLFSFIFNYMNFICETCVNHLFSSVAVHMAVYFHLPKIIWYGHNVFCIWLTHHQGLPPSWNATFHVHLSDIKFKSTYQLEASKVLFMNYMLQQIAKIHILYKHFNIITS